MRKNVNIELMRICACFFVISIHLWGTYRMWGGRFQPIVLLGNCITGCAVPLFLMITGYLFDPNKSIIGQYKRLLLKVILPTVLTLFFYSIVLPEGISVLTSFLNLDLVSEEVQVLSIGNLLKSILCWNVSELPYSGHLWYIGALIQCYLLFPIYKLICRDGKYEQYVRWLLLGVGFVLIVITATLSMFGIEWNMWWTSPINIWAWYILLGFEVKVFIQRHKSKGWGYGGLALCGVETLLIFVLSYYIDYMQDGILDKSFLNASSIFCVMQAIGMFVFIMNIAIPPKIDTVILNIGNKTFGIYLLHVFVYSILWHLKIEKLLNFVNVWVFCLLYSLMTFILTGLGVAILQKIVGQGKKLLKAGMEKVK